MAARCRNRFQPQRWQRHITSEQKSGDEDAAHEKQQTVAVFTKPTNDASARQSAASVRSVGVKQDLITG